MLVIGIIILADQDALPLFIRSIYDFPNGDKVGHFILFGLLNFFMTSAVLQRFPLNRGRAALSAGLVLAAAVAAEEFSQQYFSVRTFGLLDLTASYAGLVAGGWAAWKLGK